MIHVRASRANRIRLNAEIINFYTNLWYDRLVNLTKRKYAYALVWRNIRNVLTFYGKTFDDNQLKVPTLITWKSNGWRELIYKKWHFAVVVQLDMFGNNIAIVQDCCHDKDYHNDAMETEPFKMDNPYDKSHLVDWKNYRLKKIIRETINDFISNNCFVPKKNSLIESIQKKLNGEKFKMWFGDWENDPKNASKVVDENGMPLVVYHGTTLFGDDGNPFTEFRFQKEGWNGGMNSPGYFTDSIAVAEFFANSDSNSMFRKKMYQVRKETNLNTIDDCVSFINQYFFGNADIIQRKMNSNDKLPIGVKKMVNQESLFLHTNSELGDLFLSYAEEGNAVIISRLHDRIKKLCDIADRQRYDKELSRGGVIYPCYLSIKKPFVYNANGKSFQLLDWEGFYEKAISNDCDGIIVQNVVETTLYNYVCTDYIVFNPNQIKHAYECVDFSSNSNIMK